MPPFAGPIFFLFLVGAFDYGAFFCLYPVKTVRALAGAAAVSWWVPVPAASSLLISPRAWPPPVSTSFFFSSRLGKSFTLGLKARVISQTASSLSPFPPALATFFSLLYLLPPFLLRAFVRVAVLFFFRALAAAEVSAPFASLLGVVPTRENNPPRMCRRSNEVFP